MMPSAMAIITKAEGHAHQKGQLHDAAGFLRLSGSQCLRHRHVKADGQRNAQIAEEPRGGRHHTDSGRGIGPSWPTMAVSIYCITTEEIWARMAGQLS